MHIHDMSRDASIDLLTHTQLCRLACYVVPIYCAYHNNYLYGFSRLGQKIVWMRTNPRVCVEADEVASPRQSPGTASQGLSRWITTRNLLPERSMNGRTDEV